MREDGLDSVRDEDVLDKGCYQARFACAFIAANAYSDCVNLSYGIQRGIENSPPVAMFACLDASGAHLGDFNVVAIFKMLPCIMK